MLCIRLVWRWSIAESAANIKNGLWINTDSIWDVMRVTNADSPRLFINYRYGETEGHSIVLEMNCGNMIYVDKQQNTSGNMVFMTDGNGASYFYMYGKKITDFMIFHNCGI